MNADGITIFTQRWLEMTSEHQFLLKGRDEIQGALEKLARRLAEALTARPFSPDPGYQIGVDLVAVRIATPQALGHTSMLIGQHLLDDLGLQEPAMAGRLVNLLGAMVTGFTTALRDQTFAEQEALTQAVLSVAQRDGEQARLHDHLTGLPRRELLTRRLAETRASRLGLCLINLDRFKEINDGLGHHCGDQILRAVAGRLSRLASESGHFLAYLGADEFAVLVEETAGPDDVTEVARRALHAVAHTFPVASGQHLPIEASAGVVERPAGDRADLIGAAHLALGWAKAECRGRWVVFDPERGAAATERYALTAAIPHALARGEFTVHYQPLVGFSDGNLVGVEALVRWRHPTRGLLTPGQFIDLAERTGLIVPLGLKVLQRACTQAAYWRTVRPLRPLFVSVNVAAAQLHQPGLPDAVTEILDRTGLPPDLLQLEVTENALLDPTSLSTLDALTQMGARIALDDFGTGYCRLGDLSTLPVHTIKTAACLVDFLRMRHTAGQADEAVLTAIIGLSHKLGLSVTAEGIETAGQARRLAELGCDTGQGYHFGQARPAEQVTHLLELWKLATALRSSRRT